MKQLRVGMLAFAAVIAAIAPAALIAAEVPVLAQDLTSLRASSKVISAVWTRREKYYTLQVVYPRPLQVLSLQSPDSSNTFMGNTIANLRGTDPAYGVRTLSLVDGRRPGGSQAGAPQLPPMPPPQMTEQKVVAKVSPVNPPRIQVWLLRADGTQILPVWRSGEASLQGAACNRRCDVNEILFRVPHDDGAQAVAAAIQVDDEYYIEKLKPLTP